MASRPSRRNSALKYYVNGRRAQQLNGLADLAGNALSAYDTAVTKAVVGLKRRALPAASRAVRQNYNIKATLLREKFRVEAGLQGRRGDRDDYISIWASTRQISLHEFGGKWRGRKSAGATAMIAKGAAKTYDGAFMSKVGWRGASGGAVKADTLRPGIFVRSRAGGRRVARGPLRRLYGPSPFEMLSGVDHAPSQATQKAVLAELTVFYTSELRRQWRMGRGL